MAKEKKIYELRVKVDEEALSEYLDRTPRFRSITGSALGRWVRGTFGPIPGLEIDEINFIENVGVDQMISWKVSRQDVRDIQAIAHRAVELFEQIDPEAIDDTVKRAAWIRNLEMDLTACHANGCPLQLGVLRHAPDPHFGHDVFGIRRFIDRTTGQIPDGVFWPRLARPVMEVKS